MRKIFMTMICFWAVSAMFAQTSDRVEDEVNNRTAESKENTSWFVSAGIGTQIYFGDHNKQMKLGNRLSPALDLTIGKWLSDKIGIRFMYSGLSAKGATQHDSYTNGKPIKDKPQQGYWLKEQKFNFFNLHGDVLFNLSNIILGKEEQRFYNCVPYAGLGWGHILETPSNNALSVNLGVLNVFRLTSKIDLNLDIRAAHLNDGFDGERGERKGEGVLSITAGAAYRF